MQTTPPITTTAIAGAASSGSFANCCHQERDSSVPLGRTSPALPDDAAPATPTVETAGISPLNSTPLLGWFPSQQQDIPGLPPASVNNKADNCRQADSHSREHPPIRLVNRRNILRILRGRKQVRPWSLRTGNLSELGDTDTRESPGHIEAQILESRIDPVTRNRSIPNGTKRGRLKSFYRHPGPLSASGRRPESLLPSANHKLTI